MKRKSKLDSYKEEIIGYLEKVKTNTHLRGLEKGGEKVSSCAWCRDDCTNTKMCSFANQVGL